MLYPVFSLESVVVAVILFWFSMAAGLGCWFLYELIKRKRRS